MPTSPFCPDATANTSSVIIKLNSMRSMRLTRRSSFGRGKGSSGIAQIDDELCERRFKQRAAAENEESPANCPALVTFVMLMATAAHTGRPPVTAIMPNVTETER